MRTWTRAAIVFGVGYALAGIIFAMPATYVQFWRLAAWGVSGILLAMHIAYERFRLENHPFTAAWHIGLGAAIGGFGSSPACRRISSRSASAPRWRACDGRTP